MWKVASSGAVLVAMAAMPARAEPAIVLDRCPAFDRAALHAAIQRELVASAVHHDVTLVIACPDAVTAHLSIEPDQGLARTLDLGEVPGDLRLKLLAIAAVELAVVADPAKLTGPASERPAVAPPPADTPPPPAVAEAPPPPAPPADTIAASELPRAAPAARFALSPRVGVRFFRSDPTPMPHVVVEGELDRLAAGITATRGADVQDPLGTLAPYLYTASASVRLFCWGVVQLACMRARIEAGVAGVTTTAYTPMVSARDARAFYGQAGLAMDVEHSFGALGFVAMAEAAWAEGLVATAQEREPVRLAGPVFTTVIGIRWRP